MPSPVKEFGSFARIAFQPIDGLERCAFTGLRRGAFAKTLPLRLGAVQRVSPTRRFVGDVERKVWGNAARRGTSGSPEDENHQDERQKHRRSD
jgi:hypothetical protein